MINENPSVVHGAVLVDSIIEAIACLREKRGSEAFRKLKQLADSLLPLCYIMENGVPVKAKSDDLKIDTKLNDFAELDALRKNGRCKTQIDLIALSEDLEKTRWQIEQNNYPKAIEDLEGILAELKKLGSKKNNGKTSKYEFSENDSELFFKAKTELSQTAKTLYAKYIEEEDCKKLLEKYIDQAYQLGQKEMKEEMSKKTQ